MSFSAEPGRRKAYQSDMRWRIVYQKIALNYNYCNIARHLNILTTTAHRVYTIFKETGNVAPKNASPRRKLDSAQELFVIMTILENPSMFLDEVCRSVQSNLDLLLQFAE